MRFILVSYCLFVGFYGATQYFKMTRADNRMMISENMPQERYNVAVLMRGARHQATVARALPAVGATQSHQSINIERHMKSYGNLRKPAS